MKKIEIIQLYQQQLPLFIRMIDGHLAFRKLIELELSITDSGQKDRVNELLDKIKETNMEIHRNTQEYFQRKNFLLNNGVTLDIHNFLKKEKKKYE